MQGQKFKEPFGQLGYEIKRDVHKKDLDAKIIITSHNSRPGLGKTTLAIKMCRDLDRNGWSAESKAFMDAHDYHEAYGDKKSGSAFLFDEIEGEADSRRAMSNKNVELSQAWAQNRYRNMITICTLPSVSMLDNRMMEMSDYWINVIDRGVAHPYRIRVNDFNGKVYRVRMGEEQDAVLRYSDLSGEDDDYNYLKSMKHDRRTSVDKEYFDGAEVQERVEKAREDAKMEERNEWFECLNEETDLSQTAVSKLSKCGVSRPRLVQILQGQ